MNEILSTWKQKLTATKALYEGPVQIALDPKQVLTVLDECCPEEFAAIHENLQAYTPTHVLLTCDQVEKLLNEVTE